MKLFLNNFFFLICFISLPSLSENYFNFYNIKVSGISIGKLEWKLTIEDGKYQNKLDLYRKGFLSAVYKFDGKYYSEGIIEKKILE